MTAELQRTPPGTISLLLAPAHVIGSAVRYGYEPVATFSGNEKMLVAGPEGRPLKSLKDPKGGRLGLPSDDSLAAYLALGEFNSKGLQIKSYFKLIRNHNSHDVALYSLGMGVVDVAVAEQRVAQKWLSENKGRVIYETRAVPSAGIALNTALDKTLQQKIR